MAPVAPPLTSDHQRALGLAAKQLAQCLTPDAVVETNGRSYGRATRRFYSHSERNDGAQYRDEAGLELTFGANFGRFFSPSTSQGMPAVGARGQTPRTADWRAFQEDLSDIASAVLPNMRTLNDGRLREAALRQTLAACLSEHDLAEVWPQNPPEPAALPEMVTVSPVFAGRSIGR